MNQTNQILTSVAIKNAVELSRGRMVISDKDTAERIDELARLLYEKHVAWLKELSEKDKNVSK